MSESFKINKSYAEKYNAFRQKEELQKLKDRYGDQYSESSSSSESEDEDAEALTEQVEKDWLRTLAALKSKDPRIYQKDVQFYHDQDSGDDSVGAKKKKEKRVKPMFIKDYDRKVILEKGGMISDDDNDCDDDGNDDMGPTGLRQQMGYHEEQENLRKSIAAAVDSDDESGSEDGLLQRRKRTREDRQKEEEDYLEWMKGQKDRLETDKQVGIELAPLKNYWEKPDLDAGEKFLKNYILNKQYLDKDEVDEIPTYDEVVGDGEGEGFSDEEELLTKQDTFERKYNFRFEEPGATEVRTFPRSLEDTVRRKDAKRTDKRKEVKERKKRDKEKKKEEIKQLKNLKRQEIMSKIEKLREITGNKTLAFDEEDLEEDFDPKKHDEMMQKAFDDQYYDDGEGEEVKPVIDMSDEDLAPENWDSWTGTGPSTSTQGWDDNEPYAEDEDFNMDADYDPLAVRESKKKKKKRSKLAQVLSTKKPVFDPKEKTFEEYFDEYYKLDYEDIIDDMPCRFKYRKVTPNNFGLSTDEILKSTDKELNTWVGLKKMSQYRSQDEEQREVKIYNAKGKNIRKKQNVLFSIFESEKPEDNEDPPNKKQKLDTPGTSGVGEGKKKKKKKKKQNMKNEVNIEPVNSNVHVDNDKPSADHVKGSKKKEKKDNVQNMDTTETGDVIEKQVAKSSNDVKVSEPKVNVTKADTNEAVNVNKEVKSVTDVAQISDNKEGMGSETVTNSEVSKKKNKKKKNKVPKEDQKMKLSDERLKAYGINPKKYKYMQKEELFQIKPRKEYKKIE